jgi:hypothetical protein
MPEQHGTGETVLSPNYLVEVHEKLDAIEVEIVNHFALNKLPEATQGFIWKLFYGLKNLALDMAALEKDIANSK